jgi:hypothetical protein
MSELFCCDAMIAEFEVEIKKNIKTSMILKRENRGFK